MYIYVIDRYTYIHLSFPLTHTMFSFVFCLAFELMFTWEVAARQAKIKETALVDFLREMKEVVFQTRDGDEKLVAWEGPKMTVWWIIPLRN